MARLSLSSFSPTSEPEDQTMISSAKIPTSQCLANTFSNTGNVERKQDGTQHRTLRYTLPDGERIRQAIIVFYSNGSIPEEVRFPGKGYASILKIIVEFGNQKLVPNSIKCPDISNRAATVWLVGFLFCASRILWQKYKI
ncbi:hypothetical protein TNCV_4254921 [Trichonephila clavipes]|nr:hypothetical protein TNCV_4254921 [Trichonephila clavipes]